jgi:hypothetical protein
MIPELGCSPQINILTIGASIIGALKESPLELDDLLLNFPKELNVSMDHIILTMDWLFSLGILSIEDRRVTLNETN